MDPSFDTWDDYADELTAFGALLRQSGSRMPGRDLPSREIEDACDAWLIANPDPRQAVAGGQLPPAELRPWLIARSIAGTASARALAALGELPDQGVAECLREMLIRIWYYQGRDTWSTIPGGGN